MSFTTSILIGLAVASPYVVLLWARRRGRAEYNRWLPLTLGSYAVSVGGLIAGRQRTWWAIGGAVLIFLVVVGFLYKTRDRPRLLLLWLVVLGLLSITLSYRP